MRLYACFFVERLWGLNRRRDGSLSDYFNDTSKYKEMVSPLLRLSHDFSHCPYSRHSAPVHGGRDHPTLLVEPCQDYRKSGAADGATLAAKPGDAGMYARKEPAAIPVGGRAPSCALKIFPNAAARLGELTAAISHT